MFFACSTPSHLFISYDWDVVLSHATAAKAASTTIAAVIAHITCKDHSLTFGYLV